MGWFFPDETAARPARHDDRGVYVALSKAPIARTVSVRLRLGREVLERTGWADGQRLRLAWSNGPEVGRVMAVPSDDKGPVLRFNGKAKNFLSTKFGHVLTTELAARNDARWALIDEPRPLTKADAWACEESVWSLAMPCLIVTLPPEWWKALEPQSAAEASSPEEPAAAPEERKRAARQAPAKMANASRPGPARGLNGGTTAKAGPSVTATAPANDQVALAHRLLDRGGLLDSELIKQLRCTPAFLEERKRERSLRASPPGPAPS